MPIDLSNHKWPVRDVEMRSKPEAGELTRSAYKTFVNEGSLYARVIDFNGQMRAIPRECSFITALGYEDGVIYGATRGEQSWLFQYALHSFREAALPLGPIPNCNEVRGLVVKHGKVYLGANNDTEGRIVKVTGVGLPGDVIQEWGQPVAKYEDIVTPVAGEKIIRLFNSKIDPDLVYGLTAPGGILFKFTVSSGEVTVIGPVDPVKFYGNALIEDAAGNVYAFGTVGKIMKYDPNIGEIKYTGISIPCFPGRGPYAKISAAVYDQANNRIFAGDTEGLLSIVCLDDSKIIPLGKPVPLGGIDHLVRIEDGRIYGLAGGLDGMSHLFVQDSRAGSLRDLGVCCTTVEKGWYGYNFGAMLATPGGRIVMGEDDYLGCLFSYYPVIA